MAEENNKKSIFRLTDYDNGIDNDWRDRIEKLREETYGKELSIKITSLKEKGDTENERYYQLAFYYYAKNLSNTDAILTLIRNNTNTTTTIWENKDSILKDTKKELNGWKRVLIDHLGKTDIEGSDYGEKIEFKVQIKCDDGLSATSGIYNFTVPEKKEEKSNEPTFTQTQEEELESLKFFVKDLTGFDPFKHSKDDFGSILINLKDLNSLGKLKDDKQAKAVWKGLRYLYFLEENAQSVKMESKNIIKTLGKTSIVKIVVNFTVQSESTHPSYPEVDVNMFVVGTQGGIPVFDNLAHGLGHCWTQYKTGISFKSSETDIESLKKSGKYDLVVGIKPKEKNKKVVPAFLMEVDTEGFDLTTKNSETIPGVSGKYLIYTTEDSFNLTNEDWDKLVKKEIASKHGAYKDYNVIKIGYAEVGNDTVYGAFYGKYEELKFKWTYVGELSTMMVNNYFRKLANWPIYVSYYSMLLLWDISKNPMVQKGEQSWDKYITDDPTKPAIEKK